MVGKKLIEEISYQKKEPDWMRKLRLKAWEIYEKKPLPNFGPDLRDLDLTKINYYQTPKTLPQSRWQDLPLDIRQTYEKLKIPEMEKKYLAGNLAQYESSAVYEKLKKTWEDKKVIFLDMDSALQKYPEEVKKYFMNLVSFDEHKFTALHTAFWSGGTFIYLPQDVCLCLPLQSYFRMQSARLGQFEHTIIVADRGSFVHYLEGCTAPQDSEFSLHAGAVEVYVGKQARVRFTTVQNWSKNIYNLATKRALVGENGRIEWVSGSLGSKVTMLYPTSVLGEKGASSSHLSISWAGKGQVKDTGGKVIHLAENTSSTITAKSLSSGGGKNIFRGQIKVLSGAKNCRSLMRCDSLILDKTSEAESFPSLDIKEKDVAVGHEATVGRISEEQLFYLQSRGISEKEATNLIVAGFIEPIISEIPLEYSVELNRLIEMELN
ncbi:MAG: Fe-S cluster assembly protein SufB [Patescibacteria group bacterium]|nr:Fe-S cluster assembly protein SufB [Patescibacteria group bacterium]MCL5095867.1 Fe-S cluster assembly protein SufB [Patescibacteria group bacterium]